MKRRRLGEAVAVAVEVLRQELGSGRGGTDHVGRTPRQKPSCVYALLQPLSAHHIVRPRPANVGHSDVLLISYHYTVCGFPFENKVDITKVDHQQKIILFVYVLFYFVYKLSNFCV